MSLTKHASFTVLSAKIAEQGSPRLRTEGHRAEFHYEPKVGFLYVRSRAISSRCNDNFDEFPAAEIKQAYRTFIGKPVFVNHHNADHRRARGVIIDAALHEDVNPDGTPDTWVEVLMEVDAIKFPKLAQAIVAGHIDRTSMGTDVAYSVCSACGNKATSPVEYCQHIPKMKGKRIYRATASGSKEGVLVREICYGLGFFENSLLVEEPADPTAYFLGVDTRGLQSTAAKDERFEGVSLQQDDDGYFVQTHRARSDSYENAAAIPDEDVEFIRSTGAVTGEPYPAVAITNNRLSHAAMTDKMEPDGFAPAMCNGSLWVSVEHTDISGAENGVWKTRTVPLRASTATLPQFDDEYNMIAGSVDCSRCNAALKRWESTHTAATATPDQHPSMEASVTTKVASKTALRDNLWSTEGTTQVSTTDLKAGMVLRSFDGLTDTITVAKVEDELQYGFYRVTFDNGLVIGHAPKDRTWYVEGGTTASKTALRTEGRPIDEGDFVRSNGVLYVVLGVDGDSARVAPISQQRREPSGATVRRSLSDLTLDDRALGYSWGFDYGKRGTGHDWPVAEATGNSALIEGYDEGYADAWGRSAAKTALLPGSVEPTVQAPADVDTLRDEKCPVCGEEDAFDGERCQVCGFISPPDDFGDPDTGKAKENDLRQQNDDVEGVVGGGLRCSNCGHTFEEAPGAAKVAVVLNNAEDETNVSATEVSAKAGDICPDCGQGTLEVISPTDPEKQSEVTQEFAPAGSAVTKAEVGSAGFAPAGSAKASKNPRAARRVGSHVEGGDVDMRPALAALAEQQVRLDQQQAAIARIAALAGLENDPIIATALKRTAADENPAFGGPIADVNQVGTEAPAATTGEAAQPEGKDDPESVGSSPVTDVTPDATTSVESTGTVLDAPLDLNEQDPEKVVSGTDDLDEGARGNAGSGRTETEVRVGTPTQDKAFSDGGFLASAQQPPSEARFVASLRLARLQIQAGVATGDDLALAQTIAASTDSDVVLQTKVATLTDVLSATAARQAPAPTHLVPQAAPRQAQASRTVPSLGAAAQAGYITAQASTEGIRDDEVAFE